MKNRNELAQYFRELGFKTGAEIGVLGGTYSIELCKAGMKVYCVDSWGLGERRYKNYHFRKFEEAKKRLASYEATLIRKKSEDAVKEFSDEQLDFIFIDANHHYEYVLQDITEWAKKVRKGGIISGHDYKTSHWPSVIEAVNEYTADRFKLNVLEDSTWWFVK